MSQSHFVECFQITLKGMDQGQYMISRLHLEIDSLMVKEDQDDCNDLNDLFIIVCKPIFRVPN